MKPFYYGLGTVYLYINLCLGSRWASMAGSPFSSAEYNYQNCICFESFLCDINLIKVEHILQTILTGSYMNISETFFL